MQDTIKFISVSLTDRYVGLHKKHWWVMENFNKNLFVKIIKWTKLQCYKIVFFTVSILGQAANDVYAQWKQLIRV